jgi:hypothetical protein
VITSSVSTPQREVNRMSKTPESVVRSFFAAWADPKPEELDRFFADDGVWVDGPQGVRRGAEAIRVGSQPNSL